MHLLKVDADGEIHLVQGFQDDNTPPYAILSHTWGLSHDEVSFEDVTDGRSRSKVAYKKLQFCADQAKADGLKYFWVDTCCINRNQLAELSESITSMFRWYMESTKCYVYLDDVSAGETWESSFTRCKWFTRGWTLQEMLAPTSVEFFSREGHNLGSKHSLSSLIFSITDIPEGVLRGTRPLSYFSPRVKMQWSSLRNTTRPEDKAYCLQGIFGVYIVPNYGEREYAWVRLKREIGASYQFEAGEQSTSFTGEAVNDTASNDREERNSVNDWRQLLVFDQMYSRQATIKSAHTATCTWLLDNQAYRDWINPSESGPDYRFLWIKGKPGVGKSTLVKYALVQAGESKGSEIVISFFFNARGNALEKSTMGMYRALTFQLLQEAKRLRQDEALLETFNRIIPFKLQAGLGAWNIETFCELFTSAIRCLRQHRVRCFIDALDECDEQEIRDMVIHLENLGQITDGQNLHVCFASRHYPSITVRNGAELVVETEHGHKQDLSRYIEDHLRIGPGKTELFRQVQRQLEKKANAIFLWVVLVVKILNKEISSGRTYAIQSKLDEMPAELGLLFREILCKDATRAGDLLLCIQWIIFAATPLTPKEFYCAMTAELASTADGFPEWDPESIYPEDLERFVVASSRGLAHVTSPGNWADVKFSDDYRLRYEPIEEAYHKDYEPLTVQFIHESVNDFFIKDGGLFDLWPDLRSGFKSRSHERLCQSCHRYLATDMDGDIASGCAVVPEDQGPRRHGQEVRRYSQEARRHSQEARQHSYALRAKFPFALYAARYVLYHAEQAASDKTQEILLNEKFLTNWKYTQYLIEHLEVAGDMSPSYTSAAMLHYVVHMGYQNTVKSLLARGVDVNARATPYNTALIAASARGNIDMAKLLLDAGADVNVIGDYGVSALSRASSYGNKDMVRLLLDAGADCNHNFEVGIFQLNPLGNAIDGGHTEVVKLLLNAGADLTRGAMEGSVLDLAIRKERYQVAKLLLDAGADIIDLKRIPHALLDYMTAKVCDASTRDLDIEARSRTVRLFIERMCWQERGEKER